MVTLRPRSCRFPFADRSGTYQRAALLSVALTFASAYNCPSTKCIVTTGQDVMKATFSVAAGLLCAAASFGLQFWAYPWSVYYENFSFGRGITLRSYVIMAILIGAIVSTAVLIASQIKRITPSAEALVAGLVTIFSLIFVSLILGPFGADIPGTRIRGIFFSEFKFTNFIADVAFPSSCLASALTWSFARLRR
jgi:hypothetical protein